MAERSEAMGTNVQMADIALIFRTQLFRQHRDGPARERFVDDWLADTTSRLIGELRQ